MQTEILQELYDELAERAILSAFMLDGNELEYSGLKNEDFYSLKHQQVFIALQTLVKSNKPTDTISVGAELERMGCLIDVGGRSWVAELACEIPSIQSVAHYAELVREHARLRTLQIMAKQILLKTQERTSSEDIMRETDRTIQGASSSQAGLAWQSAQTCVQATLVEIDKAHRGEASTGLPTGLMALDERIGGLRRSNFDVLAGRTSMGKSSLALGTALSSAKAGGTIGIITLEMSAVELTKRMLAMEGENLSVERMDRGILSNGGWASIVAASERILSKNIFICDEANVSVEQLRMKARSLKRQHGLDLLIIDYLQLLMVDRRTESRVVAMSEISRSLKVLAKELDIPIVALSQLNRACENRPDKRPLLSDLRETGAIEQDADLVVFLYRDEVYDEESPDRGTAELLIRKNRHGPIGEIRVAWHAQQTRFADIDNAGN